MPVNSTPHKRNRGWNTDVDLVMDQHAVSLDTGRTFGELLHACSSVYAPARIK